MRAKLLVLVATIVALAWAQDSVDPVSVSRGGQLYDKWWVVAQAEEPEQDHPIWSQQTTNTRSGGDTWRCKECHGWDYKGADGAYGSGSHFTGFPGVLDSDVDAEQIRAALSGVGNADHDFSSLLGSDDMDDLVNFLKFGTFDMALVVNYETKTPFFGDLTSGRAIFKICASCHGADGSFINFHDDDEPAYIGTEAISNPWEVLHKVWSGHPGEAMPGLYGVLTEEQLQDLLRYAQTLP